MNPPLKRIGHRAANVQKNPFIPVDPPAKAPVRFPGALIRIAAISAAPQARRPERPGGRRRRPRTRLADPGQPRLSRRSPRSILEAEKEVYPSPRDRWEWEEKVYWIFTLKEER